MEPPPLWSPRARSPRRWSSALEGVADVLAHVLDLLPDLLGATLDAVARTLSLQVLVSHGPAGLLLAAALGHLEAVLELVHETHVVLLLRQHPRPRWAGLTRTAARDRPAQSGRRPFGHPGLAREARVGGPDRRWQGEPGRTARDQLTTG